MAELIQKWRANDGSEWRTQEQAESRDRIYAAVSAAIAPLGEPPQGSKQYRQLRGTVVQQVRLALFEIARPLIVDSIKTQIERNGYTEEWIALNADPVWFCRILEGGPLEKGYSRLCFIDKQYRMWQQPYFANNTPENAECVA